MAPKKSFKKTAKNRAPANEFDMFPSLHDAVHNEVHSDIGRTWFKQSDYEDFDNEYATNITGRFKCANKACSTRGWSSRTVAIVIRGYPRSAYNAEVFNQRCKSCNELGDMTINEETYVERVAYRLKKWAGVEMELPDYNGKDGPPHEQSLCEGCKRGYCQIKRARGWKGKSTGALLDLFDGSLG